MPFIIKTVTAHGIYECINYLPCCKF